MGKRALAFPPDRLPGPAYRTSALLPGIQGSSQAVCCLGGFIFYPETQEATTAITCHDQARHSCCEDGGGWVGHAGLPSRVDLVGGGGAGPGKGADPCRLARGW